MTEPTAEQVQSGLEALKTWSGSAWAGSGADLVRAVLKAGLTVAPEPAPALPEEPPLWAVVIDKDQDAWQRRNGGDRPWMIVGEGDDEATWAELQRFEPERLYREAEIRAKIAARLEAELKNVGNPDAVAGFRFACSIVSATF